MFEHKKMAQEKQNLSY